MLGKSKYTKWSPNTFDLNVEKERGTCLFHFRHFFLLSTTHVNNKSGKDINVKGQAHLTFASFEVCSGKARKAKIQIFSSAINSCQHTTL